MPLVAIQMRWEKVRPSLSIMRWIIADSIISPQHTSCIVQRRQEVG